MENSRLINVGIFEDVEVEWPAQVLVCIPDVRSDPDLEGVHSAAVMLQFLVSVLCRVVVMLSVIIPDIKACKV